MVSRLTAWALNKKQKRFPMLCLISVFVLSSMIGIACGPDLLFSRLSEELDTGYFTITPYEIHKFKRIVGQIDYNGTSHNTTYYFYRRWMPVSKVNDTTMIGGDTYYQYHSVVYNQAETQLLLHEYSPKQYTKNHAGVCVALDFRDYFPSLTGFHAEPEAIHYLLFPIPVTEEGTDTQTRYQTIIQVPDNKQGMDDLEITQKHSYAFQSIGEPFNGLDRVYENTLNIHFTMDISYTFATQTYTSFQSTLKMQSIYAKELGLVQQYTELYENDVLMETIKEERMNNPYLSE